QELVNSVVDILADLSEQERLVVALYYYEELTLKEIGMVMGVTESRVSQVHTAAIMKLRAKLRSIYSES
ncbi:MAG: sigma-70 family RNA polymerase sigma factor, partial [Candidatus Latescibacteria bacterium]|nr:sigma-70 family RNA polymerase sigma factor [Candidatus Latescibacterota bacterium]